MVDSRPLTRNVAAGRHCRI